MSAKKGLWLIVQAVVVLCAALMPHTAKANNAAIVIGVTGCTVLDGNGNFVSNGIGHVVVTSNGQGLETCRTTVTPSSGGGAVQWDNANTGLECGDPFGHVTTRFQETVSASGQASLACHFD